MGENYSPWNPIGTINPNSIAGQLRSKFEKAKTKTNNSKEVKLEPVEKFKLSPEMVKIEKAYKQRDKILKMLKGGIALKSNELIQMTNALNGVEQQQKMLLKMVPPEQQQVDGMPLPSPDLEINY